MHTLSSETPTHLPHSNSLSSSNLNQHPSNINFELCPSPGQTQVDRNSSEQTPVAYDSTSLRCQVNMPDSPVSGLVVSIP